MRRILTLAAAALVLCPATAAANPVIAGDHPDPSVARIGGAFYASATSGSWAPLFPVFRSTDLVSWTRVGAVLRSAPRWASGKFWAPELTAYRGRALAFYSAARHGGKPCIGVATATRAEGPWRDRGRAVCPPLGAIDAAPVRGPVGRLWLAWKQLGVGSGIYLQALDASGLRASGAPIRLVTPDAGWEHGVTEGPSFLHVGSWWYLFYSGGTCCRVPCSYAEGVARAPTLQGPYVKAPTNPVLRGNRQWKCPGHGTAIDLGARGLYLLHHAYTRADRLDERREVLLDAVTIDPDGWPAIAGRRGPAAVAPSPFGTSVTAPSDAFSDGFGGSLLTPGWEWPFDRVPRTQVGGGRLTLSCDGPERFVARQVPSGPFAVVATLDRTSIAGRASLGLAVSVAGRSRGIELAGSSLRGFVSPAGLAPRLGAISPAAPGRIIRLLLWVPGDGALAAYAAVDDGAYSPVAIGPARAGLPPTRMALTCRGHGTGGFTSARVVVRAVAG